ncbi:unnamed protein product [Paramecium pentaurelia]|uniref:Uncharacterized protein n=1 Tax=Paramecium pentaurelia TaxID=43138 RepID=A0A8S1XMY1_9CILI|nr:unnamed protein product [Paramecium pentaurelia]
MATFFFPLLSIASAKIKDLRKWNYFNYESKTQFWSAQCGSFQIYRILLQIVIIEEFINYPEAQSILLSMLSYMYLIYLLKFKPLQLHLKFLNQFVEDSQLCSQLEHFYLQF